MNTDYKIINVVTNKESLSLETTRILTRKLQKNGFIVADDFDFNAELTICVGGDGSLLRTLHKHNFPDIPVVGVNTGHLGFFQELAPHELDEFIFRYKRGNYKVDKIIPIEGLICTRDSCIEVLGVNEIVIKGDKSTTIHLNISLDENFLERFSGDGILLATPTGSTAYNYSLGGSIVDPRLNLMQITPIAPINTTAYRSFTSSIVVPKYSTFKIQPEYMFENSITIVVDGMEHRYKEIVEVQVKMSELQIKLIKFKEYGFWNKVKEKFL